MECERRFPITIFFAAELLNSQMTDQVSET